MVPTADRVVAELRERGYTGQSLEDAEELVLWRTAQLNMVRVSLPYAGQENDLAVIGASLEAAEDALSATREAKQLGL